jgi:hypothetical protein
MSTDRDPGPVLPDRLQDDFRAMWRSKATVTAIGRRFGIGVRDVLSERVRLGLAVRFRGPKPEAGRDR